MTTWMIYITLGGFLVLLPDEPKFTNEAGCQMYLASMYKETVRASFQLRCLGSRGVKND